MNHKSLSKLRLASALSLVVALFALASSTSQATAQAIYPVTPQRLPEVQLRETEAETQTREELPNADLDLGWKQDGQLRSDRRVEPAAFQAPSEPARIESSGIEPAPIEPSLTSPSPITSAPAAEVTPSVTPAEAPAKTGDFGTADLGTTDIESAEVAPLFQLQDGLSDEFMLVWNQITRVLGIVVVSGADGKPVVTVGTLLGGCLMMWIGYIISRVVSNSIVTKLGSRVGLPPKAAAPIKSISFYALLFTFTMLTLNILSVPLTVFSFLGGAIAIGAGFGSQNIVNNFISGLILLAERPVRVGDIVEIDGMSGKITEIGARSTKLRTASNFEIVVPNSKFLENNVVNWTLSDDEICTTVNLGVAYGSNTRNVETVLLEAAASHPLVLNHPAPEVVFLDFGESALQFQLRIWIRMSEARKFEVESDVRFRIDELFAEHGIVMSFPQRDVHLHLLRPLEVRMTDQSSSDRRGVA